MIQRRIIRHSGRPSRNRVAVVLATAIAWSLMAACQLVIGDLPLLSNDAGSRPADPSDRSPADALSDTSSDDAVPEGASDVADTSVGDADLEDADTSDADSADAEPCDADVPWYPDADGDGYGRPDGAVMACPKPPGNWARATNDCNDRNASVHPGQTSYFGTPYPTGPTNSFDYDCSGSEDKNPAQSRFEACGLLDLALCSGSGYARGPRSGIGVDPVCGSTTVVTCQYRLAILLCEQVAQTVVEEPFRCR